MWRDLCFSCRRHQVDKKDLLAPVSSSWMRTIGVNTGADSQVTHIYCRDVSQNRSEPRVIRNLTQANFTFLTGHAGESECSQAPAKCFVYPAVFLSVFLWQKQLIKSLKISLFHLWVNQSSRASESMKLVEKQLALGSN